MNSALHVASSLAPECPQCHRRSFLDGGCVRCGYGSDAQRPCGCPDSGECDDCAEVSACDGCGEDGIPVRVLAELCGFCPRCSGAELAREAAMGAWLDEGMGK